MEPDFSAVGAGCRGPGEGPSTVGSAPCQQPQGQTRLVQEQGTPAAA